MSDHTDYGISADVLARAAEAIYTNVFGPVWDHDHPSIVNDLPYDDWCEAPAVVYPEGGITPDMLRSAVCAALPVLVPAVQDDVTRRIKAWICQRAVTSPSDDYNEGYQDALAELWEYLSATEEAPDAK